MNKSYKVAVPKTIDGNGIAEAIYPELEKLGHRPEYFPLEERPPADAQVVLLFGPFGKFLHIPRQYEGVQGPERPTFVYWNTEGLPDLRWPRPVVRTLSEVRSWLGRFSRSPYGAVRSLAAIPPLRQLEPKFLRFRYLGDYLYAHRQGWVDVFADISAVYADYLRQWGLPALHVPFGSFEDWYDELHLDRDIDVLWMGKRGSRRRSQVLDRLRAELRTHGVDIYMVDNVEHPFVFDEERTEILNRAKITLNLLRTWYDENSLRICLAAPNRSLVVSEPLLAHVPHYQAGVHYVSAPIEDLAKTILYYLQHDAERQQIIENAYQLLTEQLTFGNSIDILMQAAHQARLVSGQSAAELEVAGGTTVQAGQYRDQ